MSNAKLTEADLLAKFREVSGLDAMPDDWTPAGLWVRVSSGGQDEENQVPSVIRHCIDRHYWPARWYIVHAKSAFHGEHQADLDRAVADMRDGRTSILVIWHSSRLERRKRKGASLLDTLAEFVDAGGRVESVQEPALGRNDMGGEISTFITGLMNHEKSSFISESVKLSIERNKASGSIYGRQPWGFTTEGTKYDRHLVPTGVCREYAPQIFQRCIDGQSLRTIAAWLDSEGVPTPRGNNRWHESSVRCIIRNRVYAGSYYTRSGVFIQKCEAVVRPSVWDRANQALKTRPKRGPVAVSRPMLAGLRCARCGASMYRIKNSSQNYFYRCFGNGPQRKGCGNMVGYDVTEFIVASQIFVHSAEPHRIRTWIEGVNWDDEISDVKQAIREAAEAERFEELPELQAQLAELRGRESTPGHYDFTETDKTVGEYFWTLDADGKRKYLATRDIRVEKVPTEVNPSGIRVIIDGIERPVTVREWNAANRHLASESK
jgi:DNA invertase Pin-like site-specific DNA recombinase